MLLLLSSYPLLASAKLKTGGAWFSDEPVRVPFRVNAIYNFTYYGDYTPEHLGPDQCAGSTAVDAQFVSPHSNLDPQQCAVSHTQPGEFLAYRITRKEAYGSKWLKANLAVSAKDAGKRLRFVIGKVASDDLNDREITSVITDEIVWVPAKGFDTYSIKTVYNIDLDPGNHYVVQVTFLTGGASLYYIDFVYQRWALPTTIPAKGYDVSHDTFIEHNRQVDETYCDRGDGVDMRLYQRNCVITQTLPGEYWEYNMYVRQDGAYTFSIQMASDTTNQFAVKITDKSTQWSSYFTSNGAGINEFEDKPIVSRLFLQRGVARIRIEMKGYNGAPTGYIDIRRITVTKGPSSPTIPGKIQAQDYDRAYDMTPDSNDGGSSSCYRGDGVDMIDVENESGTCAVGYAMSGEWLEYDVQATETGFYKVDLRVAGEEPDHWFHVELDGLDVTGKVNVPTNGWVNYETVSVDNIYITEGQHTLRVFFDTGAVNFNWFSLERAPRRVTVTAVMARNIKTCISGVPCDDEDDPECYGIYREADQSFIKGFRDVQFLPSTVEVPSNHDQECLHLTFDETVMADIANELDEMTSKVYQWSKQQLKLDIDIIDVPEEHDVYMTKSFNTQWLATWDFERQIRSRLTYNPDFTLVFNNIRDPVKGIYHQLFVCGLAYGTGLNGMAGGGYSWIPVTDPPFWFSCYDSHQALIHEWMHEVHTAYTELSGFDDKFDRNYPPCDYVVTDPLSYFPDSHDIFIDPGSPWCGTSESPSNDLVMEYLLSKRWDPRVNFTTNHCENGVRDYGELGVDKGGIYEWSACLGHSIRPLDAAEGYPTRPDPIPQPETFLPIPSRDSAESGDAQ